MHIALSFFIKQTPMSHDVLIQSSEHRFTVYAGETVLQAALRQGIALPYSCRNGGCGSCTGDIIEGQVSYAGARPAALSAEDAARGKALLCQALAASDLVIRSREIATATDIPVRTMPCRVQEKTLLSHDVMQLKLKLPATERLQFLAGQYLEILLKDGRRRSFSIANAPHDDEYLELHIRLVVDGEFTDYVFNDMPDRALLRIEGPLGNFFLREESSRPIIMMAGGTGIAPLKGMIEHALHSRLERPMHLFWGVRSKRDLYLHAQIQTWTASQPLLRYTPVLSAPLAEDDWQGESGLVTDSVCRHYPDMQGHEVYMSGPPAMIAAARDGFRACGAEEDHLYSDAFEFAADSRP